MRRVMYLFLPSWPIDRLRRLSEERLVGKDRLGPGPNLCRAPGDESPFVVNVPNVSDVARYRVTFRSGNGVVRHTDRRDQVQLAQAVR